MPRTSLLPSPAPSGVLLVEKPAGMTSHDVVDAVRRISGVRRVGHAGTLDPLATGLLVILVGSATKQQQKYMSGQKEYVATMRLGATSTTDDAEGTIRPMVHAVQPTAAQVQETLARFLGEIEQVPPIYSAVKVAGQRAYALAWRGETPKLKPRRVTIASLELLSYQWPEVRIRVVCSPGTYIRAIARDVGAALGCGAYIVALTRTRSGTFSLADAKSLTALTPKTWRMFLRDENLEGGK